MTPSGSPPRSRIHPLEDPLGTDGPFDVARKASGMTVDPDALVLPAFEDLADLPGEATPWHNAYDLDRSASIDGVPPPVRYGDRGVAVVPTGIGKTAAATTTAALCSSPRIDLDGALVLSVGAAGGPPALPIGSVVVADTIVDWDDKCRVDPDDEGSLALNPYTDEGAFELDAGLLEEARAAADAVDLSGGTDPGTHSSDAAPDPPTIAGGTNLCGDELWHGRELAAQAAWLVEANEAGPYRATEMEDAGTAAALERFGRLDRYLSVRGISNHDRPPAGVPARESLLDPGFEAGFGPAIENAVRVARSVIEDLAA